MSSNSLANQQLLEVTAWLHKILGTPDIPKLPTDHQSIEYLYELMQRNQVVDKQFELIIQDFQQKAEEYAVAGDRLRLVLQRLHLGLSFLSSSGQADLLQLATAGALLKVASSSHSNMMLVASAQSDEAHELSMQRLSLQRAQRLLQRNTQSAVLRATSLDKALEELSTTVEQGAASRKKHEKEIKFYQLKSPEYLKQIDKLQSQLTSQGYCDSLSHSALEEKSEKLESALAKLRPIKSHLESYHSLPPDKALTRVRVEELKKELAELQRQLEEQVDLVHM